MILREHMSKLNGLNPSDWKVTKHIHSENKLYTINQATEDVPYHNQNNLRHTKD